MLRAGFSAFWSLAIEEQFYLVWPVLVAVLGRRGLGWGCAILFAGAVGSRLWLVLLRAPVSTVYVVTPARLDPLLFGAVLAAATRSPGGLRDVPAGFAMFVGMVGLVAFVVLGGSPAPASTPGLAMAIFTLAVGWSGVLVATVRQTGGLWGALMRSAGLRWLGRYSYAMYLLQLPLDHALRSLGFTPQRAGFWTFGAVGTATVCLAAYLSWHVWEKRWLALTERFPRRAPQLLPVP
jgi:peptidoglycan/LPS O-acetylase OafA/YrhL